MSRVLLLLLLWIPHTISTRPFGISNAAFPPGRLLFGRQGTSCDSECESGEQCCGDACISADLSCCPDGQWYCDDPVDVCVPCQSGGVCYDDEGDQTPWNCCSNGGSDCVFSVSSGTVSSSGTVAPSSSTPPSNPTTTATPAAASPVSPTPILAAATSSMLTPPSGPNPSGPILTAADPGVTSPNTVPAITTPTQPPWSGYNYHESLLVGTCATPEFSLVCGAQATAVYLIGIVGCMGSKTDCCPYQVPSTTATVATTVTDTAVPITEPQFFFPTATVSSQVTLPHCPADYVTISSVCCPAGYQLWGDSLGGITPCFSVLSTHLTPPPSVAEASTVYISGSPIRTTSTVLNVVYARNYPVSPPTGLDTTAKVGIGVGVGVAGALAGILSLFWLWRWWRRRPERSMYPTGGVLPGSGLEP